ncbi:MULTISPECIES: hypothetical protein [Streptomyces]|uniref:Uncharacterized protein n=1 Tax=Streptomyces amritsarensis TaxID=681158 RepID=A0ABX3G7F1_9ACTN|nr:MULTISPECIES: hypothetical protein [Streptomyces]AQT72898.1 hypothetical protein B1K54_15605 [Streptomyces sp. fd1-xmd]MDX6761657.1 hypothetical protein [Streptomyces sp. F8]OLZ67937.1 hypothetical protein AVW11_13295 [Streptomyces amritsarensis]
MSTERAQGRGWVRIPASRGEQSATPAGHDRPAHPGPYAGPYPGPYASAAATDPATIYLSVVRRWREAGRTLPGHPDEEWERLISQPCWPGR